jgi:hypothetical protein
LEEDDTKVGIGVGKCVVWELQLLSPRRPSLLFTQPLRAALAARFETIEGATSAAYILGIGAPSTAKRVRISSVTIPVPQALSSTTNKESTFSGRERKKLATSLVQPPVRRSYKALALSKYSAAGPADRKLDDKDISSELRQAKGPIVTTSTCLKKWQSY